MAAIARPTTDTGPAALAARLTLLEARARDHDDRAAQVRARAARACADAEARLQERCDALTKQADEAHAERPELLSQVADDRAALADSIAAVKSTKAAIADLASQREHLAGRVSQLCAAGRLDAAALIMAARHAAALEDARHREGPLRARLSRITAEIKQSAADLTRAKHNRARARNAYTRARDDAVRAGEADRRELADDLRLYEELGAVEMAARHDLRAEAEEALSAARRGLGAYDVEAALVLEDQRELEEAWCAQEEALNDSLQEIESDATMLAKQSKMLRYRAEHQVAAGSVQEAEVEAELFHVKATMQTKHAQLQRMRERISLIEEERAVVRDLVARWRGENDRRRDKSQTGLAGAQALAERAAVATGSNGRDGARDRIVARLARLAEAQLAEAQQGGMLLGAPWPARDEEERVVQAAHEAFVEDKMSRAERLQDLSEQVRTELRACEEAAAAAMHGLAAARQRDGTGSRDNSSGGFGYADTTGEQLERGQLRDEALEVQRDLDAVVREMNSKEHELEVQLEELRDAHAAAGVRAAKLETWSTSVAALEAERDEAIQALQRLGEASETETARKIAALQDEYADIMRERTEVRETLRLAQAAYAAKEKRELAPRALALSMSGSVKSLAGDGESLGGHHTKELE